MLPRTGVLQRGRIQVYVRQSREQSTNLVAETTWLQLLCLVPFFLFFRHFPRALRPSHPSHPRDASLRQELSDFPRMRVRGWWM